MSPSRRPLRVARHGPCLSRLLVLSLLLSVLPFSWPGQPAANAAAASSPLRPQPVMAHSPAALSDDLPVFIISWTITARADVTETSGGLTTTYHESIQRAGYATAQATMAFQDSYAVDVPLYNLVHQWQFESLAEGRCVHNRLRMWNTDPGEHARDGGFPYVSIPALQQQPDGSWSMMEPLDITTRGLVWHERTENRDQDTCDGDLYESSHEEDNGEQIGSTAMILQGDSSGTSFKGTIQYKISGTGGYEMDAERTVTVTRQGGCAGYQGTLDASSPLAQNLTVSFNATPSSIPPNVPGTLQPPEPVELAARVTCEGVPIANAEVTFRVNVEANSGGHRHGDKAHPRPRGYLRPPGAASWTRLTEAKPFMTVKTDDTGTARLSFRPGMDIQDQTRGIAGDYKIKAEVVNAAELPPAQLIHVARTDFVELPEQGPYYVIDGGPDRAQHPEASSARPATVATIVQLAADFWGAQVAHNEQLQADGKPTWPPALLAVNDMSLKDGGLFDVTGNDVVRGKVFGQPWGPPHYGHMNGTSVDLRSFTYLLGTYPGRRSWLIAILKSLGSAYGAWEKREPSLHLEIRPAGAAARASEATAAPDPAVTASLSQPAGLAIAAPGQLVAYTLSADNLRGGAPAEAVALSAAIPPGLEPVSADPSPAPGGDPSRPTWNLGTLPAGALPVTASLTLRVANAIAPGTVLTVTGVIASAGIEAEPLNNHEDAEPLAVQPSLPDLVAFSDLAEMSMTPGSQVSFTIGAINLGAVPAPGAELALTLPPSVALASASPAPLRSTTTGLVWSLGDLPAGADGQVEVTVTVASDLLASLPSMAGLEDTPPLTFTLGATSVLPDLDPASNSVEVALPVAQDGPDLVLTLNQEGGERGTLAVGGDVRYTLRYANGGNQVASGVGISLSLPAGLEFVSATPPPTAVGPILGWRTGDVLPGAAGDIELALHVASLPVGGGRLLATASTQGHDPDPLDNIAVQTLTADAAGPQAKTYLPLALR